MIIARGLTKTYGEFKAVDGIDFEVRKGEAFGLLGPNGAGKSTTMKMIASVSKRTGGELTILGLDPNKRDPEIRAHLGVVPQQDNLDRELKVHENLYVYGRFFGLGRTHRVGEVFGPGLFHIQRQCVGQQGLVALGVRRRRFGAARFGQASPPHASNRPKTRDARRRKSPTKSTSHAKSAKARKATSILLPIPATRYPASPAVTEHAHG